MEQRRGKGTAEGTLKLKGLPRYDRAVTYSFAQDPTQLAKSLNIDLNKYQIMDDPKEAGGEKPTKKGKVKNVKLPVNNRL